MYDDASAASAVCLQRAYSWGNVERLGALNGYHIHTLHPYLWFVCCLCFLACSVPAPRAM
jgi:hypothetical protein